jgi:hypothetical protein
LADFNAFRRSNNIDDRRSEVLQPALGFLLNKLGLNQQQPSGYEQSSLPIPPLTPLGASAGINNIEPGHQAWLAERERARLAAIQSDPNIHSFDEKIDPSAPPVELNRDKRPVPFYDPFAKRDTLVRLLMGGQ